MTVSGELDKKREEAHVAYLEEIMMIVMIVFDRVVK
jgi:hypothetical protein